MEPLSATDPRMIGGFRIESRIGAGGMGQVYLGFSPAGRAVAVKVVHPELAGDSEFLRRFAREAAAAKAVSGMYTAPVVATGLDDDPPWLATAYVPGPSLADYVARHGPLPEAAVWRLAAGLTEALRAVHGCGLVHRDLKPGNVLLAEGGPYLIDFGISRALDGTALTMTGKVIGTPGYMAPEHVQGGQAEPASDVFSLGCVLAYAATGNPPYGTGNAASVLYRIVNGQPDLTGIPAQLGRLVSACLASNPAERPRLAYLTGWTSHRGPGTRGRFWPRPVAETIRASPEGSVNAGAGTARMTGPPVPPPRPPRRRTRPTRNSRTAPTAAGVIFIALLAGLAASSHFTGAPSASSPPASSATQTASSDPADTTLPTLPAPPTEPSATPSPTPSDPLAEAWAGECFSSGGSEQSPDLQAEPACQYGDFKVDEVLGDTIDESGCDGVAGDDWNYADDIGDQVLCFTYLNSSSAYYATVRECVYGPFTSNTIWSVRACQVGAFTVVGRYADTTDTSDCGQDMSREFTVGGYPSLDVLLCLRMNFPVVGTVPINTCLQESGTGSYLSFYTSACYDANVVVTGRTDVYDDPAFCGPYASYWWHAPGYPNLGFTTCLRRLN